MHAGLAVLLAASLAMGCGNDTTATSTVQLLDVTLTLTQGVTCDVGGVSADFTGTAGKTVTALASGSSNLRPQFVLYAPDYSTQLASSAPNGSGRAKLTFALTQTGQHHLTLCDANGAAGALRVTVTTPVL